jgi:hypothetical protein
VRISSAPLVKFITTLGLLLGAASLQACGGSNEATATCGDEITNGNETDVDCGGGECFGCRLGETCRLADDCQSGLCEAGVCAASQSCTDGLQNGDETDVDCGGMT